MKKYNAARTYQFRVQLPATTTAGLQIIAGFTTAPSRNGATHGATVDHLPQPVP